jgi:beta-galactosidase
MNDQGKHIDYYLNYSNSPATFTYSHKAGVDLLTGKKISTSDSVTLNPWDLMIVESDASSSSK